MAPTMPDLETEAATMPAREPAWSSAKLTETYLGSSVAASPAQAKVGSGAPVASTQMGDWSTPTNQMSGLSCAAWAVSPARLKPTVTMTLKPWSTNCWMSAPYSEESL